MKTMRTRTTLAAIAVWTGCALAGTDAAAQVVAPLAPPLPRPTQGLFGRQPNADGFDMTVMTFEGYDDDQIADALGVIDPRTQKSGTFDGVDFSAGGRRKFRRISFDVGEQSSMRYYPGLEDFVGIRHEGRVGLAGQFQRTRFSASQMVAYAPFYSYTTMPLLFDEPLASASASQQILQRNPAFISQSSADVSQTMGRVMLMLSASTSLTDFRDAGGSGLRSDSVLGGLLYHLNKDLGVVARYGVQRGIYETVPGSHDTVEFDNMELGLDYNHQLSLTRKTTVSFATGTAIVRGVLGAADYRLVAHARVSREIARTWHATGSYDRGASLLAGFTQPIYSDDVQVGVTGSLSRRLTLATRAGVSTGELTGVREQNTTGNRSGSAQLQYALSRMLALTGEYAYYQYQFGRPEGLPVGLPLHFARNSVRLGLTVFLPLFN